MPTPVRPAIDPQLAAELANINRRVRIVEDQLATLRSHIDMLDSNLVEKHKSNIDDIKEMQASIREVKVAIKDNKEMFDRIINRLNDFASKENVKVLERYINFWNPLHYVTKRVVEDLIKENK